VAKEPAELNDLLVRRSRVGGADPSSIVTDPAEPDQMAKPPAQPRLAEAAEQPTAASWAPSPLSLLPEPSDKVVMQNVQVRLPEPVADRLRLLAPMLRRKQQGILEEIITNGINELWHRVEERRRAARQ
jgi:hypothetical protein